MVERTCCCKFSVTADWAAATWFWMLVMVARIDEPGDAADAVVGAGVEGVEVSDASVELPPPP